ncbi:RNA polymerase sigma factor [Paenibacillus arenosi]|uniref:RNA polymerase sigma factor n=1 Tax=Paenibacillus arenosi TaxID=2774142 RepID=A0ABR9B0C7_9BACL|nr:RNA polymerase sigma factor [Paenibacillus arenosi]MBD8499707.1 RNA polymerase sigma factor [Paenibacillus arenosi]
MSHSLTTSHETVSNDLEQLNAVLSRYCLSLTHSVWDSEDLVQDTWVKVLDRKPEQEHNNPEALLLRTAKNTWIDQVRRKKVLDRILNQEREQWAEGEKHHIGGSSTFDIEIAFYYVMKYLSPLQRTVFLLRGALGYSVADTANKLQTTEGAVKAAYHRARKELQSLKNDDDAVDAIVITDEEDVQWNLSALVRAYVNGEVEEVVRLVQGEQGMHYVCNISSMVSTRAQMKNKAHRNCVFNVYASLAA